MQKITAVVLKHKRIVIAAWIVLTIIGMAAAGPASKALDQKFSVPGREGWDTNAQILKTYGNGGESVPIVPVVTVAKGKTVSDPGVRAELRGLEGKVQKSSPRS